MVIAVLDACVLLNGALTDFLLNLAEQEAFEPIWSDLIHQEWMRNLGRIRSLAQDKLVYRREQMDLAFPGACCDASPEALARVLLFCGSPRQRKDAHVAATALASEAGVIVTFNLKDFPETLLTPLGLRAMSPDAFCLELAQTFPEQLLAGARAHRGSLKAPRYDLAEYLAMLASPKVGLKTTAMQVARLLGQVQ